MYQIVVKRKAGADEERKRQEEEKRQLAVECFEAKLSSRSSLAVFPTFNGSWKDVR